MKDLVIIGAGDFGREIANVVERINCVKSEWNLLGFIDDNIEIQGKKIDGYSVIGTSEWLNNRQDEIYAICSLGVAKTRKKVISKFTNLNIKWATLIDPDARLYKDCEVGAGSIICGGSILAINTKVHNHVIVNLNCTLGHDDIICDYCVINPGVNVSGKVLINECVDLGTGVKAIQGLTVGKNSTVGAGAVVIKDVPENCTAVGTTNIKKGKIVIHKKGFYERHIKRIQDFLCALLALIVLSPVFVIIAILVKIKLGSPILFKQERPGLNEQIFTLYKFRTMTDECDEKGELLPDEVRLTKFGKALRATSLDELPELLNIIKGDMAVVGPRPLLVRYLPLYNDDQKKRHLVRPGFTGYAQVNGRNTVSWEDKFAMDVWYANHITFVGDLKIILATVSTVFKREGISSETSATMEEFCGTSEGVYPKWNAPE